MNYPGYVGETADDDAYHISHPGLGYKYSSDQALPCPWFCLKVFIASKIGLAEYSGCNLSGVQFYIWLGYNI